MKLKIFAVRDRATIQFGTPMFLVADGQAIRSFIDEVNRPDKDNQIYQHPDDFDLYAMGEYETTTGIFTTEMPVQVITGKQARSPTN
jgi:hypothetical protein